MLFYKNYLCYSIKKLFTFFIFFYFFFAAYYKMEDLKLKDLNLSLEESRDIIEFLARKSKSKRKSDDELWHALKEYRPTNNQQQQIKSKNKETIHVIREELKELSYKISKSELKEIKKNLYQIENKKGSLE